MIPDYPYRPVRYFSLTFITTYLLWFAGAWLSFQEWGEGIYMMLLLPGLMAPFLISVGMVAASKNPDLKTDFYSRIFDLRRIRPGLLMLFSLVMPLSVLVSIAISLPLGGSTAQLQLAEGFSFSTGFVPVLLLLFLAASFEELGWRGYAFDSLQSRYSFFKASIIFGLLWSLWHFPLVFVKDSYQYEIFQENFWFGVNFFISIIPLGVIISWICIRNRKSIPAAILFHFVINMSQEMLEMTQVTKCIQTVVLTAVAAALVYGDEALSGK